MPRESEIAKKAKTHEQQGLVDILPDDILPQITGFLGSHDLAQVYVSSKKFRDASLEHLLELLKVKQLIASGGSTFALTEEGKVFSWGGNESVQLGLGDNDNRYTPTEVTSLNGYKVQQLILSYGSTFALTEEGRIFAWGRNYYGQLGLGENDDKDTPTEVTGLNNLKVKQLIVDGCSTFALTEEGKVFSWGNNGFGQLGLGDDDHRDTPKEVTSLNGYKVKKLFPGSESTFALTEEGRIFACGRNVYGQLGLGDNAYKYTPTEVTSLNDINDINDINVKELILISGSTFALTEEGSVFAWGNNYSGKLGLGDNDNKYTPTKVTILNGHKVKQFIVGKYTFFALTEGGRVFAWGNNHYGSLGLGDNAHRNTPTEVTSLNGYKVKQFIVDGFRTFALTEEGSVFAWGRNIFGELGLGDNNHINTPTKVTSLNDINVKQLIVIYHRSTFALTEEGKVFAWGRNGDGQLGLGHNSNTNTNTPSVSLMPYHNHYEAKTRLPSPKQAESEIEQGASLGIG